MARTCTSLKPIGIYFPLASQPTYQAPRPDASQVTPVGVIGGLAYNVFFAINRKNILWLMLESTVAGKAEWVRCETVTNMGDEISGGYVGPVYPDIPKG